MGNKRLTNPNYTFNGIFSQIYSGIMQYLPIIIYALQYLHKHIIMFARRLYGHPNKVILREILNVILLTSLKEYLSKD